MVSTFAKAGFANRVESKSKSSSGCLNICSSAWTANFENSLVFEGFNFRSGLIIYGLN